MSGVTVTMTVDVALDSGTYCTALARPPIPLADGPVCERCWLRYGVVCGVGRAALGGGCRCGHGGAS